MSSIQETLDLIKSAQAQELAKGGIRTGHNLVPIDLQAPAKSLYPVNSPLRNVIPRVQDGIGLATNWRVIKSVAASGPTASPWVGEGQRSGVMSMVTEDKAAKYVTLGEENDASFESVSAGAGFEDILARARLVLLQRMMMNEEHAILGGNASLTLAVPAAPTLTAGGSGGTLPAATYSVAVVALTYSAFKDGSLGNGIPTAITRTSADGSSIALNGGCSAPSAASTAAVTLGQKLSCSTPAVRGAVGYAWFVGAAGAEKLEKITSINSAVFEAPLTGGARQPLTAITGDFSANPQTAFDGLLTTAFLAGSGAYVKALATGTPGVGSILTPSGSGSVAEIDEMFLQMWEQSQVSPSVIYCNARELKAITACVLAGSSGAPLVRMNVDANGGGPVNMTAGGVVGSYFNPYSLDGGMTIPIKIHPYLPPGTVIGWTNNLPIQYQQSNITSVAEIKCRKDYHAIDWSQRTRRYEMGVYAEEVMAVYFPAAMGILHNIASV